MKLILSVPHRAFFSLGAMMALLMIGWWLLQFTWPVTLAVPAGWAHAWLMTHGLFVPFTCGFLFTAMPQWVNAPPPSRRFWLTALILHSVGLMVALLGVYVGQTVFAIGWTLVALSEGLLLTAAVRFGLRGKKTALHAPFVQLALLLALSSVLLILAWTITDDWHWAYVSIRLGVWGFLLPLFLTVGHRMVPFFTQCVTDGYQLYRPGWALIGLVALSLAHLLLELRHAYHWLWLSDGALLAMAAFLLLRWRFWVSRGKALLSTLYLAWGWLLIGLALLVWQSAHYALAGEFILGRGPQHAITIGFLGSMLVAMSTRVSLGHSGRSLQMDRYSHWCYRAIHLTATLRVLAELRPDPQLYRIGVAISALVWLFGFGAWAFRYMPIYWRPRVDGRVG